MKIKHWIWMLNEENYRRVRNGEKLGYFGCVYIGSICVEFVFNADMDEPHVLIFNLDDPEYENNYQALDLSFPLRRSVAGFMKQLEKEFVKPYSYVLSEFMEKNTWHYVHTYRRVNQPVTAEHMIVCDSFNSAADTIMVVTALPNVVTLELTHRSDDPDDTPEKIKKQISFSDPSNVVPYFSMCVEQTLREIQDYLDGKEDSATLDNYERESLYAFEHVLDKVSDDRLGGKNYD
jgi:hypothetical protein